MTKVLAIAVVSCAVVLLMTGCGTTKEVESLSAEERFAQGIHKFNDGDYLEAIEDFKVVTMQFPGSTVADDAEYYMAESRYRRGEYILAGAEYDMLVRTMPSSPFVPKARYMKAMSDYNLSPKPELDQKYTREAIEDFQTFLEYSPNDSAAHDAATKIGELNNKLARKEFENGRLYYRLEYYKAAITYFDNVLERYHDTEYADDALLGKARAMRERRDFDGALEVINLFLAKYPSSELRAEVESLKTEVEEDIASGRIHTKKSQGLSTRTDQ